MADFAQEKDSPVSLETLPAQRLADSAVALREALLAKVTPDRSTAFFLGLVGFTAMLSLYVFLEENFLNLVWRIVLADSGIHASTTLAVTLALGTLAGGRVIRSFRTGQSRAPSSGDLAQAIEILSAQPNASAGLVRLGDKKILFSECGKAFIMYARSGRSWAALFDPVGCRKAWPGLVVKFIDEARKDGCRAVFYQVSADFLPCAVEARLNPYKLGEQAVVDLTKFDLKGGAWLKLRRSINRAERDGLEFSMLAAEDVPDVLDELLSVSRTWLASQNSAEKGFSLGKFQPGYVAAGPVAVIRLEGRIVAFANILSTSSQGDAFIDLMRHVPDTHRGMMDLLFVRIMERMKADGFRTLNLGMAPLAGLSTHRKAPLWNHIAGRIFRNGERFYNFKGVLAFKSKFDPDWHPRYLAVSGRGVPVVSLFDITMLIGGGLKGVLRR
jgi:phosphatidylglycerol lysyltransferase